ncbi:MAG TPA: polysaccharide biosynthesis C-terminal domain-containing protein [Nocardioides sp.]|uniref:lipopolysaccharide biosynthesis protein n=1 Tax=Nocardioides sp. TaxID=35761 RepID=UPI002BC2E541|nr:polysaccharide biosynthesis C-terminal domain-containing protein [Nocardioides sp.]HQR26679.1 polysaccharide biosynthesis C-terminal domain-containing protein [Nocardioides sp.]
MSESRELHRLARGGLGGLLASVITGLGGLAFITIAARAFPKADVGVVFTVTSLFLIALAVVTLGSDIGLVRFVAMRSEEADSDHVAGVLVATLAPVVVISVGAAAGLWFLLPLLGDGPLVQLARLFALFLPFGAVSNLVLAATRGLGTVRPTVLVESLLRQGLQPLLALLVALRSDDVLWLGLAWVTPYAVSSVAGTVAFRRLCRQRGVAAWVSPRSPAVVGVRRELWAFNGPRAVTQIAQIGIRRADIPIVAALAGPSAAAVYTAASRFVAAGLQGIKGIQQMVGPQIARLVAADRIPSASLALRTATTWNVVIAWPLYLVCAVAPGLVLLLFGRDYESGTPVVVILALGMLIGTAAGPVDIALLMLGRSAQSLVNNMTALVTNLLLNLTLVPVVGITGAALAWSVAIVVSNALPTWQIRPILGSAADRHTALAAGLAVAAFAVPPLLARLAGVDSLTAQAVLVVLGGLVYLALLHTCRRPLRLPELAGAVRRRRGRQPQAT